MSAPEIDRENSRMNILRRDVDGNLRLSAVEGVLSGTSICVGLVRFDGLVHRCFSADTLFVDFFYMIFRKGLHRNDANM